MATKQDSKDVIKKFGDDLVKDIKKAIPSATGKTRDSVYIEFTKSGFIVRGGAQVDAIINGRKPTSKGAKKGSPTVQQAVLEWIKAKSIRPKESTMSQISLSWAISKSIHKKGTKGKGDIFEKVFTKQRFASLTLALLKNEAAIVKQNTLKEFKI
jgi:hypothetical protein